MTTPSLTVDERARKNLAGILRALASVGQARVAEAMGVSESTVSRWKDEGGELERFARLLAVLGQKNVGQDRECVKGDEFRFMTRIASRALANEEAAQRLMFEEVE